MISYRLGAWATVTWGILAILTAFMNLSSSPASDDPAREFVNAVSQPQVVKINEPTLDDQDNGILNTTLETAKAAIGWLVFMVNAAALNHPFWKGDLVVVRYVFLLFSAPLLFIIARAGQELIGGMFRGLSRILPI